MAAGFDFLTLIEDNPTVCFDVAAGSNGAFRAGPGRDECTGFGVPDGGRLLAVIGALPPPPPPPPGPGSVAVAFTPDQLAALNGWAASPHHWHLASDAAKAWHQATTPGVTP